MLRSGPLARTWPASTSSSSGSPTQEAALNAAILDAGQDYERLAQLSAELQVLAGQRDELESEWLEAAEQLE